MKIQDVCYLPSGRIFLTQTNDYLLECTEMRDVSVDGKEHHEVRNSLDPHIIWKHLKDYKEKWLLTVSTQKGCVHNCHFCDVANLPFKGNLTTKEIEDQIRLLLECTPYVKESKKVKIGFARMGEPAHNLDNVLSVIQNLNNISESMDRNFNWLPCFNSILPKKTINGTSGYDVIDRVLETKNKHFNGHLHFQISVNSTDERTRHQLFKTENVLSIEQIVQHINQHDIQDRTVTLNFIVMDEIEVDVNKLVDLGLNGDKFAVKLIPLNKTNNSENHGLQTYANYQNYEKLIKLGEQFRNWGIPTVVDAIAKCEEAGLCCGQLAQIFLS